MTDTELISSNRAEVVLRDGTAATPVELVVECDQADFTVSGFGVADGDHAVEIVQSRGELCDVVDTDKAIPQWSLSAFLSRFTSAQIGNIVDFIRRTGAYSTNVSTLGAGRKYTLDILFRHTNEAGDISEWEFTDNLVSLDSFTEGRPATLAISGQCLGTNTRTHTPAA